MIWLAHRKADKETEDNGMVRHAKESITEDVLKRMHGTHESGGEIEVRECDQHEAASTTFGLGPTL